jgi:hypothetical protein
VRFLADRSVRHRPGGETRQDRFNRLDFVDRHRRPERLEAKQAAERCPRPALVVHQPGVFLEDVVLPGSRCVLQLEHRVGIEEMQLAVAPPLVLAAAWQFVDGLRTKGARVALSYLFRHLYHADTTDLRRCGREVLLYESAIKSDRFEDLRAAVTLQRGDAHLRHHLQHALVERLDVIPERACPERGIVRLRTMLIRRVVSDAGQ